MFKTLDFGMRNILKLRPLRYVLGFFLLLFGFICVFEIGSPVIPDWPRTRNPDSPIVKNLNSDGEWFQDCPGRGQFYRCKKCSPAPPHVEEEILLRLSERAPEEAQQVSILH
jgi:hypothetical protein